MHYICKRCGYKTFIKSNMKAHLNLKNKCTKNVNVIGKSDLELYNESLIPYNDDITYKCEKCNKSFTRNDSYKRHINNGICKKNKLENNNTININNNNLINSNIIIDNCVNKTINNIQINIVPFDEKWDTSHLQNKEKNYIITSLMKYTTLLNEILNNEKNTSEAIIFKNNEKKYINIDKNDLYKDIMLKLKNELTDIIQNLSNSNNTITNLSNNVINILSNEKYTVIKKYNEYENNKDIRKCANEGLENILLQKSQDAEDIAKNIMNN